MGQISLRVKKSKTGMEFWSHCDNGYLVLMEGWQETCSEGKGLLGYYHTPTYNQQLPTFITFQFFLIFFYRTKFILCVSNFGKLLIHLPRIDMKRCTSKSLHLIPYLFHLILWAQWPPPSGGALAKNVGTMSAQNDGSHVTLYLKTSFLWRLELC